LASRTSDTMRSGNCPVLMPADRDRVGARQSGAGNALTPIPAKCDLQRCLRRRFAGERRHGFLAGEFLVASCCAGLPWCPGRAMQPGETRRRRRGGCHKWRKCWRFSLRPFSGPLICRQCDGHQQRQSDDRGVAPALQHQAPTQLTWISTGSPGTIAMPRWPFGPGKPRLQASLAAGMP
jgi:hypothetical protein